MPSTYDNINKIIVKSANNEIVFSPNEQPTPPTPTPVDPDGDVRFLDYDGTVVNSYTAADFANLTALPANSTHEGLTAQGWNWELAAAKTYVASYGKLDIGQMYTTSDGKTRIYITLGEGRLEPRLVVYLNGTVDVDWGDGSTHSTLTGTSTMSPYNTTHKYAAAGDYVIAITPETGTDFTFASRSILSKNGTENQDKVYMNCVTKVELGSCVTSIGTNAFYNCYSLQSVTIPSSVTSIGSTVFYNCSSLQSVTIPSDVTSFGEGTFYSCCGLRSVAIPNGVARMGLDASSLGVFYKCYNLQTVAIPGSVTNIVKNTFSECCSLQSVTIPSSVTSIGSAAFYNCNSLRSVTIPSSVTSIDASAFSGCYSLQSVAIPGSITSIGSQAFGNCFSLQLVTILNGSTSTGSQMFYNCNSLRSVTIPSSVTSIANTFYNCSSLQSVTIPSSVTSIASAAFYGCYGLGFIRFSKADTPPTVSGSNAWSNVQSDCLMLAPALIVNLYMNGKNYPNKNTYTYLGYATYTSGDSLPSTTTDETHTLTWYASVDDAVAQTNPITVGTGNEVYARAVAV